MPRLPSLDSLLARIDPRLSWTGYLLAAGTLLSVGLTLSEPSASQGLGLPQRLIFWLTNVFVAMVLFELAQLGLGRLALFETRHPLWRFIAAGLIGAAAFALLSFLLLDRLGFLTGNPQDTDPWTLMGLWGEFRDSGPVSVLFWILLNSPRLVIMAQQKAQDVPAPDVPPLPALDNPPLIDLLSRLPRRIGSDIVALSAELHYLRVHTRQGEALILMSFGRAVQALSVLPGLTIHRSHWVALAHVAALENQADRLFCRLDNGLVLPVSRSCRPALRQAIAAQEQARLTQTAERLSRAQASQP